MPDAAPAAPACGSSTVKTRSLPIATPCSLTPCSKPHSHVGPRAERRRARRRRRASRYCVRRRRRRRARAACASTTCASSRGRSEFLANSVRPLTDDAQRVAHPHLDASLRRTQVRTLMAATSCAARCGRQRLAGRLLDELVPAQRRARARRHARRGGGPPSAPVDEPPAARAQRRVELRRDELPVEVVLVVDGHDGEVDLRRPVGRVAAVGPRAPAGSARRGPTTACRGRRRGRRTGRARSSSSRAPSGRT